MVSWAESFFELTVQLPDGTTLQDHVETVEEALGHPLEDFERFRNPPEHVAWLFGYFADVARTRTWGVGPNPIQYSEVRSWSELIGVDLDPWQVRAVLRLDAVWLQVYARSRKSDTPKPA